MKLTSSQVLLSSVAMLLAANLGSRLPAFATAQAAESGPAPEVLRARTLELVDERGQVRASLKTAPDGEVVFRMMDASGNIRIKLGASGQGSGLVLIDDRTEPGVHMLAQRTGTSLTLSEKGKESRVLRP